MSLPFFLEGLHRGSAIEAPGHSEHVVSRLGLPYARGNALKAMVVAHAGRVQCGEWLDSISEFDRSWTSHLLLTISLRAHKYLKTT
jgi:hypothetical protein